MHAPGTKDGHRFGVQRMAIYVYTTIMKNFIWSKDMCNIHHQYLYNLLVESCSGLYKPEQEEKDTC